MTVTKSSAKVLVLKLMVFIVVACGLFWLANFYARAKNLEPTGSGFFVDATSSAEQLAMERATSTARLAELRNLVQENASSSELAFGQGLKAPILMYHYIEKPTATTTLPGLYLDPVIFENQLEEIIKGGIKTVFMSNMINDIRHDATSTEKIIALTFDDGYEDFYVNAFPLLKKYNLKGTLYVIINAVNKPGYITTAQLKEMAESGYVEIGSHTFNHPDLRIKKASDQIFEIKDSKTELEKIIGQPVLTFAYPYGYYNENILTITKSAGYLGAVSVIPGSYHPANNPWLITRLRPGNKSGAEFLNWINRNLPNKANK